MRLALFLLIFAARLSVASCVSAQPLDAGLQMPWRIPDINQLPDDAIGQQLRLGGELINHTTALIGPDVSDPQRRYSGNGLQCTNLGVSHGNLRTYLTIVTPL